uniref:Uncharacterized protein n=1 Tax=Macaca fascicularis TaxID=9541 RepID=A0A7N9ID14_MACFA
RVNNVNIYTFLAEMRSKIPYSSRVEKKQEEKQWLMPVIPALCLAEDGGIAWSLQFKTSLSNIMR